MVKKRKIENVADAKSLGEVGQIAKSLSDETWSKFPNFLITNPKYAGSKLSNDAKILYLLMRTAFTFAVKNKQMDDDGNPFIYYTIDKMMDMLGKSRKICTRAKQDLVDIGLIYPDPKSGHFDPRLKANTPKRYYLLVPDYTIGDLQVEKSPKPLGDMDSPKGNSDKNKNKKADKADKSTFPENDKNTTNAKSGSKPLGDMDSPKGNSDKNDNANLRSLESTIPLEKNENSKSSKALSHMDSPKGNSDKNDNKKAEKPDKSTFPENDKNTTNAKSGSKPLGDMDSPKGNSDKNDNANLRSLESTIPLEKNENSKSSKALSHMDSPKGNSDKNDNKKAEKPDKSTFLKNENFNEVPSALLPLGQSKNELNKDRYIDNIYNSYSYFNTPINLLTNNLTNTFNYFNYFNSNNNNKVKAVKDIKDSTTLEDELNKDIPNMILNSGDYNVLREDSLTILSQWLRDHKKVEEYVERISYAVKQEVTKCSASDQKFYEANKERIMAQVSGLIKSRVNKITHPTPKFQVKKPEDFIFIGVRDKVADILHDHSLLTNPFKYSNKRVEKGTDWSKKHVDTNSNVTTEQLRELFKDLKNK